eukprot:TRINITY_DN24437_c0_g1_i1.p1 TRINITY_DN24437_c0_g1~~TRINITY_DN24437_c0_g1_i1.p1  ORF type:complete len:389 (+),score=93.32 TRINITY_DN24437_c0_g1_i1:52-1218(+)
MMNRPTPKGKGAALAALGGPIGTPRGGKAGNGSVGSLLNRPAGGPLRGMPSSGKGAPTPARGFPPSSRTLPPARSAPALGGQSKGHALPSGRMLPGGGVAPTPARAPIGGPMRPRPPARRSLPELEKTFTAALEALQESACELTVQPREVRLSFDRLMQARDELRDFYENRGPPPPQAAAAGKPTGELEMEPEVARARLAIRIGEILDEQGGSMQIQLLGANPEIQQMRKGFAANLTKFLGKYPDTFELVDGADPNHKTVQVIGALSEEVYAIAEGAVEKKLGKKARKRVSQGLEETPAKKQKTEQAPLSTEEKDARKQQLADLIVSKIQASETGSVSLQDLGKDPEVAEVRLGAVKSLKQFAEGMADTFEVVETDAKSGGFALQLRL